MNESDPVFNNAIPYLNLIQYLVNKTAQDSLSENPYAWLKDLQTLYNKSHMWIGKGEDGKKIKKGFAEIIKLLNDKRICKYANLATAPTQIQRIYQNNIANALDKLHELDQLIMKLLDDNKLLMPKIKKAGIRALSKHARGDPGDEDE